MGNSFSSVYRKNPVARLVWEKFHALLVPLGEDFQVYDILIQEKAGFHRWNTVSDLCCKGETKDKLARIVKKMRNVETRSEPGPIKSTLVKNLNFTAQLKLLFDSTSFSSLWRRCHTMELVVPWMEIKRLEPVKPSELFDGFYLDMDALPAEMAGKTVTLFLVTKIIKVPFIQVSCKDEKGEALEGYAMADLGTGFTTPVTARVEMKETRGCIFERGHPKNRKPFTLAFEAVKCVFKHGCFQRSHVVDLQFDGEAVCEAHDQGVAPREEPLEDGLGPYTWLPDEDEDMAAFANEDHWFANVTSNLEPSCNVDLVPISEFDISQLSGGTAVAASADAETLIL